jgi:uncharacterized protein
VRDGLRVRLRVTPGASADRVVGIVPEAEGGAALKVTVTAVAEGGKANAALIALLARTWRLAKRDLTVVAGVADRRKWLEIAGDPVRLRALIDPALGESAEPTGVVRRAGRRRKGTTS